MARPSVPGFTLDGETSRDLDDAIWAEDLPGGGWRLTISIADVAEAVLPGDALDRDAFRRVETRYLRSGNIPMLPRHLAEGALSLFAGEPREVLAVLLTVDPEGSVKALEVQEARLVSSARLDHALTDRILRGEDHPLQDQLRRCQQVAQVLLRRRQASGACALYDPRKGLYADEDGVIRRINGSIHAQIIVQEFMIVTNAQVAAWMAHGGRRLLFRNHEARASSPKRVEVLRQIHEALLHPALLPTLQERMTLWMERAAYGPALLGHFALNLPAYTHVTSPIRRYADLVNHRQIKAALHGHPDPYGAEELGSVASQINAWREMEAEATAAHFKERAIRDRRETLAHSVAVLEALDGPSFGRALEQAVKDGPPGEALLQALERRQELTPMDLFHLFFVGREAWTGAQQAALGRLRAQPHQALMALEIARQKNLVLPTAEIQPSKGQFLALQRVIHGGVALAPAEGSLAPTKKTAVALAAVAWLEGWIEGTLVPADQVVLRPPPAPERAKVPVDGRNYVGLLNEWSQQHQAAAPEYAFRTEGPAHQPNFRATVNLRLGADVLEADGEPATSKQEAKRLAARALFDRLPG